MGPLKKSWPTNKEESSNNDSGIKIKVIVTIPPQPIINLWYLTARKIGIVIIDGMVFVLIQFRKAGRISKKIL